MRIAIDATAAVSGGKVYLDHLLPCWGPLAAGHEFTVFHVGDLEVELLALGRQFQFRRARLPSSATTHGLVGGLLKMMWRLVVLPWHLRRLQPDVLFSTASFGPAWRPARTRLVLALHNSIPVQLDLIRGETSPMRRMRLVLLRRLMRRALSDCDGVIVFSEDLRQRIRSSFPQLKRDPSVVYHGIEWGEEERRVPPDAGRLAELGIHPPYLLYVSHFHRYKNVVRLLEGFALVRTQFPHVSLVLAGEATDPVYWGEAQATIVRLGLGAAVRHVGPRSREELKDVYRGALAFVYPSLAENCPFAVLEALALGLPIAAARASSLPEICGEAAIFFDPHDPGDISEALGQLVSRGALREDLGRKAVARAQAFSWPEAARLTLRILESQSSVAIPLPHASPYRQNATP